MKNKNYSRNILIFCIAIGILFLIKSRWVSKSIFDFMVTSDIIEIKKECMNLREDEILEKNNTKIKNYQFDNYYISTNGVKICNYSDSEIKILVEERHRKLLRENWEFVY